MQKHLQHRWKELDVLMKTIYCTKTELKSLFYGNETLLDNFEHIEISHFDDEIKKTKSQKKVLSFEDIKHPIFNPKENSIIIFDRRVIERDFKFLMNELGFSYRDKLYSIWKERNVKVVFNFAFWEALEYETSLYDFITTDFPFQHLKLTDYQLFRNKKNFIYDKLYNVFHYFNENLNGKPNSYPVKPHTEEKQKLFSSMQMKLRPHRLYFLKKLISSGLYKSGYITGTKFFFDEYIGAKERTDNNSLQNKYYYEKDNWDFFKENWEDYTDIITDSFKNNIWVNHTQKYNLDLEYDKSFVDIFGETHSIYNTKFPIFTEKAYQPIFFEKMFLLYGGNEFYRVWKKLGGHNFFEEFGLPNDYDKIESPYTQVDLIVDALSRTNTLKFSKTFSKSQEKIKENKNIILKHHKKLMDNVLEFISE